MSNGADTPTFDPDAFMAKRQGGSAQAFDPDEFMAKRQPTAAQMAGGAKLSPQPEPTIKDWLTGAAIDRKFSEYENATPSMREAHPVLSKLGEGRKWLRGAVETVGNEAALLGAPETGEGVVNVARQGLTKLGTTIPEMLRYPATSRQSLLGRAGTVKPVLPSSMQRWMVPDWMIPEGPLGSATRPGPYMEIPARMPKPPAQTPEVDPVLQAVREGRAAKLPTRMPPTAPPPQPSPFAGMTPSRGPLGKVPLPQPLGRQQPDVSFVEKFTPPEKSRIVQPGSEPPRFKVTYQSVPQQELRSKVVTGDIEAIREWQRRGLDLPPNVKFMIEGDAGTQPWRRGTE